MWGLTGRRLNALSRCRRFFSTVVRRFGFFDQSQYILQHLFYTDARIVTQLCCDQEELRRTRLHQTHVDMGAKMTGFIFDTFYFLVSHADSLQIYECEIYCDLNLQLWGLGYAASIHRGDPQGAFALSRRGLSTYLHCCPEYNATITTSLAWTKQAGLFDVSHMLGVSISGPKRCNYCLFPFFFSHGR